MFTFKCIFLISFTSTAYIIKLKEHESYYPIQKLAYTFIIPSGQKLLLRNDTTQPKDVFIIYCFTTWKIPKNMSRIILFDRSLFIKLLLGSSMSFLISLISLDLLAILLVDAESTSISFVTWSVITAYIVSSCWYDGISSTVLHIHHIYLINNCKNA